MEACLSQAAAGSGLARQREGLVGHPGGWAGQRVSQKSIPSSRHQGAGQRGCPRTRPHKGGSAAAPGILGSPGTSGVGSNLFSLSFPSSFSCLSSPPSACSLPLPLSFSALVASLLPPCFRTCRLSIRHRFHVPLLSFPSLVMPPPAFPGSPSPSPPSHFTFFSSLPVPCPVSTPLPSVRPLPTSTPRLVHSSPHAQGYGPGIECGI